MKEIKTKYNHKEIEDGKYDFWLKGGFFTAGDLSKKPYCIVLPPPNVTGKLHIGHAWDTSIQDMIIRRKRMQGYDTLWLPGTDHAGIATQAKIDAKLAKEGISRFDLEREEYLKLAWQWKEEYAGFIHQQWAGLGLSLDYTRERFTLDEGLGKAVFKVFKDLYDKGWIYQGERIINWDSQAKTALSNVEVIYKEDEGAFYYFNYPLVDGSRSVMIATTRPETMFADQAVMVHPDDERFQDLIGKMVYIPGTDIQIPVVSDAYVDMEFGTGCVKVTPAHDPNDFEVGKRHNLSMPLCMNEDGTMNSMAGKYEGMDRFECRKQLLMDLKESGLFIKEEKIVHNVGHSERTGIVVEPRLSKQWFVKMEYLADQVIKNEQYKFVPQRFKQTLDHWLGNIQDWCISRQLWWGHRIPAWYKDDQVVISMDCPGEGFVQDEDVFDTWFSSALWPFATLGWPEKTPDFERYYPNDVLVTGYDIIFFWVSRMLFQGIEFTKEAPFHDILIHGLIRDSNGRKMSKTLNNGIDPFAVIEKYGTDSLRYFLNTNSAPGMDLRYDETKIESSWNYLNKIWNIARYVMMNLGDDYQPEKIDITKLNHASKWILTKLNKVIEAVDYNFDKYDFAEGSKLLYNFVWDDFASWYVEISKIDLNSEDAINVASTKDVLYHVLMAIIKMLHPIIPFITEEIYLHLPHLKPSIMIADWPVTNPDFNFSDSFTAIEHVMEIITTIRNERTKANKAPKLKMAMTISTNTKEIADSLISCKGYLEKFCNSSTMEIVVDTTLKGDYVVCVLSCGTIYIPTAELINLEDVKSKLFSEKAKLEQEILRCTNILQNQSFIAKAPAAKIQAEEEKLASYQKQYDSVCEHLEAIIKQLGN